MNTRIRLKILVLTACTLLFLMDYATSRAGGEHLTASLNLDAPEAAQTADPPTPEPVVLTDGQGKYPLGSHLELLEDPGGELTIEQVSSPSYDAQFIASQVSVPNYGYTDSAYWVRLQIDNRTLQTNYWLLEVGFPNMYYVDLYSPLPDGEGYRVKQSGVLRPPETRDIRYPRIVFSLFLPNQSQQTIYLRFKNDASMTLALTLWEQSAFIDNSFQNEGLLALFYGLLIGLLVYNIFLLISLREQSYLYLVLFMVSLIFYLASYDGYTEIFIFSNLYYLKPYYHQLSYLSIFIPMILYADSILELKSRLSFFHWIMIILLSVAGILVLLIPFASDNFLGDFRRAWSIIASLTFLAAGIILWKQGYILHRYDVISWFVLLASLILILLLRAGFIPSTFVTENAFRLGFVGIAVFWSIALADRINSMKAETESANQELRNSERRLSQILEGMPLGVLVYGRDHKLKYINRRTTEILGNPEKGIVPDVKDGRTIAQAVEYFSFQIAGTSEKYPLENLPVYSALLGQPASADDIEMNQGNKRVPLEIWASPVTDSAGNVESAVAAFQDITQRRQTEAELAEYRKQLESLVEIRTAELNASNKELRLRLEWLAAVNLVNQTVARTADFTQIYGEIVVIINDLFAAQDSFIAELDGHGKQMKILAHSCHSDSHPGLTGSYTALPEGFQTYPILEGGKLAFLSKDQIGSMDGLMGLHIQISGLKSIALVPLQLREQVLGFLGLEMYEGGRTITGEESNLLSIFSIDIAQLIEDARLFEQARTLIATEERNRLARELHDSVAQSLYSISLFTDATRLALKTNKLEVVSNHLGELVELSKEAMSDMRLLIYELRPPVLEKEGLAAALQSRLDSVESRAGFHAIFHSEGEIHLSPEQEGELYRIAQEALNNVIKHAHADQVKVQLIGDAGCSRLVIEDNGEGFDLAAVEQGGGQGIRNIRERAEGIGAACWIESAPGKGTIITIEVNE